MKTFNKEITIQIVLFEESANLVLQCLNNLEDFKVIIVDNKGDQKLKIILKNKFQIFKYILNDKNLGYSKGHNQASEYCQTKFLLIMNADCLIKKEDILNLLSTLKKNNDCMIVAIKSL